MTDCRFCGTPLTHVFVDLGVSPLCQTHIRPTELDQMEPFYPLKAFVCGECYLVQLAEFVSPADIFSEYAYFSSYSASWVQHAKRYAETMVDSLGLDGDSLVMEIASNDGYLLQHFVARDVPVLGIEPAANVAAVAREKGIRTEIRFLGRDTARALVDEYGQADLVLGNNVLAHVPDINDFVGGIATLLARNGTLTMEFPHLLKLMQLNQYDTIYHEHFSYLSFMAVRRIFEAHGITLFDVEELPTHGGSLRIFGRHAWAAPAITRRARDLLDSERTAGLDNLSSYDSFEDRVKSSKRELLKTLIGIRDDGKSIAGYGAPGKGNTLLNYCGIRTDLLDYTVDANPYKQGTFTPGTRIPIHEPAVLHETRPDYVLILPWNLRDEIMEQASFIRQWGGRFIVPIPRVEVI